MVLDSLATALATPSQSTLGSLAAASNPIISYKIGQEFKKNVELNRLDGGNRPEEGSKEHTFLHMLNGALTNLATGNNVLAGAISSGDAELFVPVISKVVYNKETKDLTAEEKSSVGQMSGLLGGAVGALVGDSSANVVSGSLNAQNAVENNYLTNISLSKIEKGELSRQDAEKLSKFLDNEVEQLCSKNPLGDACRTGISNQIKYIAMPIAWEIMNQDVSRTSNQTFNYLYNSSNANSRFTVYFNNIDARADFFGASNQYEKNLGTGARWFGGAEKVSRAFLTGLGADGKASYLTFATGKLFGNPDLYGWRKEAGDALMNQGFGNFRNLYNNKPTAMQWGIKQLKEEQALLQPIHEKYLTDYPIFRNLSEKMTGVRILNYDSRIQYGCKLLNYTALQGCQQ